MHKTHGSKVQVLVLRRQSHDPAEDKTLRKQLEDLCIILHQNSKQLLKKNAVKLSKTPHKTMSVKP